MRVLAQENKGLTLIEMVVVILILGLTVPPLLMMFSSVTRNSGQAEFIYRADSLGRSLMEEILTKRYDERTTANWSNPLGPDTGTLGMDGVNNETTSGRSNWDDVDDFDGFSETSIANFPGFSRSVVVYYVDPDSGTQPPYRLDVVKPDSSNTLNYKRIDVTVTHSLVGSIKLSTVVSSQH